jgi:hypothetical protein
MGYLDGGSGIEGTVGCALRGGSDARKAVGLFGRMTGETWW